MNTNASFDAWTSISTEYKPFTGTFDGQNHTISGLYINGTTGYVGLFGCVGTDGTAIGTVKKVTVTGSYVSGNSYVGGVCGNNVGGSVSGCYNTGMVTGTYQCVGGVCGQNTNIGTVEGSHNEGNVTSTDTNGQQVGGVCGQNDGGTVQNSYNTGEVSGSSDFGDVCGKNNRTVSNCYYLSATSGTDSNDPNAKTKEQFTSGEVAYLLQKALDDAATAAQVWGQRIGTDNPPVLSSDANYKVYPTKSDSPCKGYSNKENDSRDHQYENGVCIYCGKQGIAYTVNIPATVELGKTVTIEATGVPLQDGKELKVIVAEGSKFEVAQVDDNNIVVDKCAYTVTKGKDEIKPRDTVLTVESSGAENSVELLFDAPATTYSGTYTGTVTFTVSVDKATT